jgi:hypothetical protein
MPVFRKDGRNVLFVHIPKNGGSTIERVFKASGFQTLYLDGKVGRDTVNHVRRCTPQHMHASMLDALFKLENFDLIFMMVRNPLARFKSEYVWRNRKDLASIDVHAIDQWGDQAFERYRRNSYLFDNHLRPQVEFYLPGAKIYHFEDGMEFLLADLNSRFGLALEEEIPTVRNSKEVTGFSSKEVIVSSRMEAKVKEFYREDYHRFGYQH